MSDLELLSALATHQRLQLKYALRMLDALGQACFLNPYF